MNKKKLRTLLGSLSGHLATGSPQDEKKIEQLNRFLLRSLLPEDRQQLKGSSFAFENAELFSEEKIPAGRLDALRSLLEEETQQVERPEFRAFVREVPVRSTQLQTSVPAWAGGAAIEKTIGPFINKDGRQFWFDFFRIEKLVALYIQNKQNPALLFKVSSGMQFIDALLPLIATLSTSYRLPAGSIWINSELFASNAPAGYYTGLTIAGGLVTLSTTPQIINGKLTIAPTTVVTVELQLQQPGLNDTDPSSPYGVDARDASLQLPEKLSFRFSGLRSTLNEISSARWKVFGHSASFEWDTPGVSLYDNLVHRVLIPFNCSEPAFAVKSSKSPFHTVRGNAPIKNSAWGLPAAPVDIVNPTPASGIGGLLIQCAKGLTNTWQGLRDGEINLTQPYVIADPGRISISDFTANNSFAQQTLALWQDDLNSYGTSIKINYPQTTPFFYFTFADGNEALMILGHTDVKIDRPVTVAGESLRIHSKNSLLILAASKTARVISLFDDNILVDSIDLTTKPPSFPKPIALALRNALFKVTPVNGCVLFGRLADDFVKVTDGFLYLTFGMHAYIPTLPDPYAANLGILRGQFRGVRRERLTDIFSFEPIWMWLAGQVKWQPTGNAPNNPQDKVEVSFHFAPLQNQFQVTGASSAPSASATGTLNASPPIVHPLVSLSNLQADVAAIANLNAPQPTNAAVRIQGEVEEGDRDTEDKNEGLPDYGAVWDESTQFLQQDAFALLDVSTNADLLGIGFGTFGDRRMMMVRTHGVVTPGQSMPGFPLQVKGMDVVSQGINVRAFTVPPISWEPVFNLTPPEVNGDPSAGFNYYPDDGGPARILNNSSEQVALAPIPLTDFLVNSYAEEDKFAALALFTLPFGLRALALLQKEFEADGIKQKGTNLLLPSKSFEDNLKSGRLLELDAGESPVQGESNMFVGCTVQVNNVREMNGSQLGNSTLGRSVTKIFNREFMPKTPGDIFRPRGVPLTRIDLSGYGASTFSNWLNPKATIAATSQTKFDILLGRCAHEIIQVKSIMYPWGVRVVRTITLLRTATNYVYRHDSGWKAESHGKFDFSYYANKEVAGKLIPIPKDSPYEIHPGVVRAVFNVTEIKETRDIKPFSGKLTFNNGEPYIDEDNGVERPFPGKNVPKDYELQPVYFNAEVEIENPVSGYVTKEVDGKEKKLIPSKRILGFVQLAPRGMPLPAKVFQALIASQQGSIGGPIDCLVNIANSDQEIRLNRFDMNNSFGLNGIDPVFVAAGRGNVILPKDGSWSLVKHENGTGTVSPVPEDLSVPLIRIGKLRKPKGLIFTPTFDLIEIAKRAKADGELILEPDPAQELLRIANPSEILRNPVGTTINYGFLHSTDTQKALFLTPAFGPGVKKLLSKTPALFADAFRLVNSKAVFPNIKDAVSNFGEAIPLLKDKDSLADQFKLSSFVDGGKNAMELMQINQPGEQGYKLLKQFPAFPLPDHWDLINVGGAFRIFIEYKASETSDGAGKLNFDVDSFAANVADKWKSRMSNVAMVVDLGPIDRLMTIKGNWDAKKGAEASFGGGGAGEVPRPQIEFSKKLKPVMDILQILQSLSGGDYADTVGKGVKLAMSNKAGAWEYKFEASKEIPLLRFPPGLLYKDPNMPLKLEAGLKLGAYFNSALMVTNDAKQLLPTAGGFLGFYGRLSVMCVSLSIVTVYAVGQANLDFGADTKTGPFLRMKFGFGAQIVVGLPVIANVSVLYVVGVEIYLDSKNLNVSAFLLFSGHADVLSGLISVTIMIEAKGTVGRNEVEKKTNLAAQVTFGLDITIAWVIDISFEESWEETRQIAGESPI